MEPQLSRVSRENTTAQLEHKMMEALVCLAEHAGELVTRRQLFDQVWATEHISDNALTHAIAEIRQALGDDARRPTYIETIHRRGYRLIAEVSDLEGWCPKPATFSPRFRVLFGGKATSLSEGENLIGRNPEAAIFVDSARASWHHARIVVNGSTATLEDLGSKNGTYLNGRTIEAPRSLENGDEIRIGRHLALLRFSELTALTLTEVSRPGSTDSR